MENEFNPSPTTEPTNDYELDPYHKRDSDFIKETFRQEEEDELTESIENIEAEHVFGITHIQNSEFENGHIRTPLGGFINNSDKPNCVLIFDGDYLKLKSIDFIRDGEEITLKYQYMGYEL